MSKQILTNKIISDIATLARLGLSASEQQEIISKLQGILTHFTQIQGIDTKGVPAADDVTGLTNVTRPDVAQSDRLAASKELLSRAPDTKAGQVKVKAVFKA